MGQASSPVRFPMPRILITNDDGVRSPGVKALADALDGLGEIFVLAPTREASAIGHALTLHHPLRLERLKEKVYAVDGTPTDCVNIAVAAVLHGLPDLVVSGINKGLNVGDDVTYSGTVSGALEASLLGVRAIAVSLQEGAGEWQWDHAARVARRVAAVVLREGLPPRTFLNVNVPRGEPKGLRVTVQGKRNHATTVSERHDPRGRAYLLDWGRAGRVAGERRVGLRGDPGGLRLGDAVAAGPDGARNARGGPAAGAGGRLAARGGSRCRTVAPSHCTPCPRSTRRRRGAETDGVRGSGDQNIVTRPRRTENERSKRALVRGGRPR